MRDVHFRNRCRACYREVKQDIRCGKCKKVRYCSKDCQVKAWKDYNHKSYCELECQYGVDYEIQSSTISKEELGHIALRPIPQGALILVDVAFRMVQEGEEVTFPDLHEEGISIVQRLLPMNGTIIDKLKRNTAHFNDKRPSISLLFAFLNHSCIPNAYFYALPAKRCDLYLVRAHRDIQPGEEIFVSYIPLFKLPLDIEVRHKQMLANWKFACGCTSCTDANTNAALKKILDFMIRVKMAEMGMAIEDTDGMMRDGIGILALMTKKYPSFLPYLSDIYLSLSRAAEKKGQQTMAHSFLMGAGKYDKYRIRTP